MKYFFNKEIETLPLKELRELQNKRLNTLIQQVYHQIPYYRKLLDQNNTTPGKSYTADDLRQFPFSHKTDLRDYYPFGLFAMPQNEVRRLHCSSGTTGKPIVVGYTGYDLYVFAEVAARSLAASVKQTTGLSMCVMILKPGFIPRSEGGKLQRISDLRKNK